jgi:hypothetical protein
MTPYQQLMATAGDPWLDDLLADRRKRFTERQQREIARVKTAEFWKAIDAARTRPGTVLAWRKG